MTRIKFVIFILVAITAGGCAVQESKPRSLPGPMPTSILVLPPLNSTVEVNAPYTFISTISRPLAERGYYVFPVAVIDTFLKNNGLPTPAEMNAVPLEKFNEHIAPDAILYTTITEWGQKYQVLSSTTLVRAYLKLVDAKTGRILWQGKMSEKQSSGDNNQHGLVGLLVSAVVDQVAGSLNDYTQDLSRRGTYNVLSRYSSGLPDGPYRINPYHATNKNIDSKQSDSVETKGVDVSNSGAAKEGAD